MYPPAAAHIAFQMDKSNSHKTKNKDGGREHTRGVTDTENMEETQRLLGYVIGNSSKFCILLATLIYLNVNNTQKHMPLNTGG